MAALRGIALVLLIAGLIVLGSAFLPVPKQITTNTTTTNWVTIDLIDETFVVPPGRYIVLSCTKFPEATILNIYIRVISGGNLDIDFFVFDEEWLDEFQSGGQFYYYSIPSGERISTKTVTWIPPAGKRICFAFDNRFSIITSKTVYARITETYPIVYNSTRTFTVYRPLVESESSGVILLIVGGVLLIVAIVALTLSQGKARPFSHAYLLLPNGIRVDLVNDMVLGRSWVASIFPNAPWLGYISDVHAVIRRRADGWYIADMGSQYGTFVNGKDIRGTGEVKLKSGDVISLGGVFTVVFYEM